MGENMNKKIMAILFLASTAMFVPAYGGTAAAGVPAASAELSAAQIRVQIGGNRNRNRNRNRRIRRRVERQEVRQEMRQAERWRWVMRNGRRVHVRY